MEGFFLFSSECAQIFILELLGNEKLVGGWGFCGIVLLGRGWGVGGAEGGGGGRVWKSLKKEPSFSVRHWLSDMEGGLYSPENVAFIANIPSCF